jgi:hypothetical protein
LGEFRQRLSIGRPAGTASDEQLSLLVWTDTVRFAEHPEDGGRALVTAAAVRV